MGIHLGYLVASAGYMTGIFLLSSSVGESLPGSAGSVTSLIFTKLLHLPLFGGLALCLLLAMAGSHFGYRRRWQPYLMTALIAGTYAGFDEWHQSLVPGRYASVGDVLLNCTGIAVLLIAHWACSRRRDEPAAMLGGRRPRVDRQAEPHSWVEADSSDAG